MTPLKARLHPRLLGSALVACLVFAALPPSWAVNARLLVAWDIGVVCYLGLAEVTTLCSWFFVHTIYAIHYTHEYYDDGGERRGDHLPAHAPLGARAHDSVLPAMRTGIRGA